MKKSQKKKFLPKSRFLTFYCVNFSTKSEKKKAVNEAGIMQQTGLDWTGLDWTDLNLIILNAVCWRIYSEPGVVEENFIMYCFLICSYHRRSLKYCYFYIK